MRLQDYIWRRRLAGMVWVGEGNFFAKRKDAVSRVDVENRSDCYGSRAVPLVVEVSQDRHVWHEVARQNATFTSWSARFSRQPAHWIRLRGTRLTSLHLKGVRAYR